MSARLPIVLSLLLAGCNPFAEADPSVPGRVGSGDGLTDRALTEDDLQPVVAALPRVGAAPDGAVFLFVQDLVAPDRADTDASADLEVSTTPATPGSLRWVSPREARWIPDAPLSPGATVDVRLTAIPRGGAPIALARGPYTARLAAPALAARHLDVVAIDGMPEGTWDWEQAERKWQGARNVDVDLVFTGAIDAGSLNGKVKFTAGTKGSLRASLVQVDGARARFRVEDVPAGARYALTAQVAAGVTPVAGGKATAAAKVSSSLDFSVQPAALRGVWGAESGETRFIDVACYDFAASGYGDWRWIPQLETSVQVSSRCQLDPERVAEFIELEPAVPFRVVPSANGFRVFADFGRGASAIRIAAGAPTVDGGVLLTGQEVQVVRGALSPYAVFTSKGRYLPVEGWSRVPIRHRNAASADLEIRHVPAHNLLFWLSGDSEQADSRTSELVAKTTLALRSAADTPESGAIDLADHVKERRSGVYELSLRTGGVVDRHRVLVTDTSLVAKGGRPDDKGNPQRIDAWALDIDDNRPKSGARIEAVRPNGVAVATCTTDASGGCALDLSAAPGPDDEPVFALVARHGDDLTYLALSEVEVPLGESLVQGESYTSDRPYRAATYTDRGVYRPGEPVHTSAVVRGTDDIAPAAGLPVQIRFVDSRHRNVHTASTTTNAAGFVVADLSLPDTAPTGAYKAHVEVAGKTVGTTAFLVEDFVPERMEVTAKIPGDGALLGTDVPVTVDGRYLFGASAEGSRVTVDCRIEPAPFVPKNAAGFRFGWIDQVIDDRQTGGVFLGTGEGTLGADGKAEVACPGANGVSAARTAGRLVADVAVFEGGSGRSTRAVVTTPIHPAKAYIGLRGPSDKITAGSAVNVSGLVVDWRGNPVPAAREVTIEVLEVQEEWDWWWEGDEQGLRSRIRTSPSGTSRTVAVSGGKFSFSWTPGTDADGWIVRVTGDGAESELRLRGTGGGGWWSWGEDGPEHTPRPQEPRQLSLELPEIAKVGQAVPVAFEAPWPGRVLWTVETDQVTRHFWADATAGRNTWTFTPDKLVPNVYVSALLVKDPHHESPTAFLADRAFGVRPMRISPEAHVMPVKITAPTQVRSETTLELTVEAPTGGEPTFATVAVVDQGVLSVTDFPTPDPIPALFPQRALGVTTWETLGWSIAVPSDSTGRSPGGDAAGLGKAVAVKPVALWSGLVPLGSDGKAKIKLPLPAYRGELRVMAMVASRTRSGASDAVVRVTDPLVVQATAPRFLTPGDVVDVPVFVSNTSGSTQEVQLDLDLKPLEGRGVVPTDAAMLQVIGARNTKFSLANGASRTAVFQVSAKAPAGGAVLTVTGRSGSLTSTERAEIPLIPNAPRTRVVKAVPLTAASTDLDAAIGRAVANHTQPQRWTLGTDSTQVWVTTNPYGHAMSQLSWLLEYPYGCIEQTSSATRPLLYARTLLPAVIPGLDPKDVEKKARSGLDRIVSMQLPSGGFSYWPGGGEPSFWGTAYATHTLIDAKKAGYAVPDVVIRDGLDWMQREVSGQREGSWTWEQFSDAEAYIHYVLAVGGRAQKGRLGQLEHKLSSSKARPHAEALYLVRAALYLAGDRRFEAQLRKPDSSAISGERQNSWSFWSELRFRSLALSVYQDLFEETPGGAAEPLARAVADRLATTDAWTTQEVAWAVSALGKRVGAPGSFGSPTLTAAGQEARGLPLVQGASDLVYTVAGASERGPVRLTFPTAPTGSVWAIVQTRGVAADAKWPTGGRGLGIARAWTDPEGQVVDPARLKLGDVVISRVVLTAPADVRNAALVDRIPAGFEVENARLGRGLGELSWVSTDELWTSEHIDIRDDRVEVFGHIPQGEWTVVTALRATSSGVFAAPPADVEAMYDPSTWARTAGGVVTVVGPWTSERL